MHSHSNVCTYVCVRMHNIPLATKWQKAYTIGKISGNATATAELSEQVRRVVMSVYGRIASMTPQQPLRRTCCVLFKCVVAVAGCLLSAASCMLLLVVAHAKAPSAHENPNPQSSALTFPHLPSAPHHLPPAIVAALTNCTFVKATVLQRCCYFTLLLLLALACCCHQRHCCRHCYTVWSVLQMKRKLQCNLLLLLLHYLLPISLFFVFFGLHWCLFALLLLCNACCCCALLCGCRWHCDNFYSVALKLKSVCSDFKCGLQCINSGSGAVKATHLFRQNFKGHKHLRLFRCKCVYNSI